MAGRVTALLVLLLAIVMVAESSSPFDAILSRGRHLSSESDDGIRTCNGEIGDCIDEEDEYESSYGYSTRFIGYAAMKKNSIPCNNRGTSYYNCNEHNNVNPYTRGCSKITRCKRTW